MLRAGFHKHKLIFKIPGGTSRGILKTKDSWFIKIFEENNPEIFGLGEASIIKKLSIDDRPDFEEKLKWCVQNINKYYKWHETNLEEFPSIKFALETAFLDLKTGGKKVLFNTDFTKENSGIAINGLIWMGKPEFMRKQIADKIENGFRCLKLKIGAIDFEEEVKLLKLIRKDFPEDKLELRVDANGAFLPGEALEKLNQLSEFGIHSIEQPIRQKQWKAMAELCKTSPIPIALDEELIGLKPDEIPLMLDEIMPQYIILKPSLLGGFTASEKFITQAKKRNIGWWVTSALEANIGLNAIAQWTSTLNNTMPQGLGTGGLFTNNTDSPLFIENDRLFFDKQDKYKLNGIGFSEASLIKHALSKSTNTKTRNWEKQIFQFILEWFNK